MGTRLRITTRPGHTTRLETTTRPGHTTRLGTTTRPGHMTRLSQNRNHEIPKNPRPESRSYAQNPGAKRLHTFTRQPHPMPLRRCGALFLVMLATAKAGTFYLKSFAGAPCKGDAFNNEGCKGETCRRCDGTKIDSCAKHVNTMCSDVQEAIDYIQDYMRSNNAEVIGSLNFGWWIQHQKTLNEVGPAHYFFL